ncbi:hypothetical protein BVY02_02045 [bacterium J17]|nr:hypothetical protein BVY02_02045 [bacterium J17]
MKKSLALVASVAFFASSAAAQNIGHCGWGSKVFAGQSGVIPQVLAATTNGTSGNQTFAISSGTSGCTQNGVVKSSWKTAMFVDGNKTKLAKDMSAGQGETLDSLANLLGVEDSDKPAFFELAKSNFSEIYKNEAVSTDDVLASLKTALDADQDLAKYSALL